MKITVFQDFIFYFCRFTLAIMFCWSSIAKLFDLNSFKVSVKMFDVLPPYAINITAYFLLLTELILSILLTGGWLLTSTFMLSTTILVLYTAVLVKALIQGKKFACYCFGKSTSLISTYTVIRNFGFILSSTTGVIIAQIYNISVLPKIHLLIIFCCSLIIVSYLTSLEYIHTTLIDR